MPEITVVTRECCELVDITRRIAALVPPDLGSGLCSVHSLHTTAALTVKPKETAPPT